MHIDTFITHAARSSSQETTHLSLSLSIWDGNLFPNFISIIHAGTAAGNRSGPSLEPNRVQSTFIIPYYLDKKKTEINNSLNYLNITDSKTCVGHEILF
jgi:hypothetical protein